MRSLEVNSLNVESLVLLADVPVLIALDCGGSPCLVELISPDNGNGGTALRPVPAFRCARLVKRRRKRDSLMHWLR